MTLSGTQGRQLVVVPGGSWEGGREDPRLLIGRASNAEPRFLKDVRIDLGRGDVLVPEQLLDGADIVALLEQASREAMAQGVWGDPSR